MLTLEEVGKSEGSDIDHYVIQGGGGSGERERRGVVIAVSHLFPLPLFPAGEGVLQHKTLTHTYAIPPLFFFFLFSELLGCVV